MGAPLLLPPDQKIRRNHLLFRPGVRRNTLMPFSFFRSPVAVRISPIPVSLAYDWRAPPYRSKTRPSSDKNRLPSAVLHTHNPIPKGSQPLAGRLREPGDRYPRGNEQKVPDPGGVAASCGRPQSSRPRADLTISSLLHSPPLFREIPCLPWAPFSFSGSAERQPASLFSIPVIPSPP